MDLLYVGGTVLFFALMLAYVRGCEALGRRAAADGPRITRHDRSSRSSPSRSPSAIFAYLVYSLLRPERF